MKSVSKILSKGTQ